MIHSRRCCRCCSERHLAMMASLFEFINKPVSRTKPTYWRRYLFIYRNQSNKRKTSVPVNAIRSQRWHLIDFSHDRCPLWQCSTWHVISPCSKFYPKWSIFQLPWVSTDSIPIRSHRQSPLIIDSRIRHVWLHSFDLLAPIIRSSYYQFETVPNLNNYKQRCSEVWTATVPNNPKQSTKFDWPLGTDRLCAQYLVSAIRFDKPRGRYHHILISVPYKSAANEMVSLLLQRPLVYVFWVR